MIAYKRQYLDEAEILSEATKAHAKGLITPEEFQRIQQTYPYRFYTPNFFARIGLFLLTVVIAAAVMGLLALMDLPVSNLIMLGIAAWVALELFIHSRRLFSAGVDDALLWIGASLLLMGIVVDYNCSEPSLCLIILGLSLIGLLRYADMLMGLTAYGAIIAFIFYRIFPMAPGLTPFVIMAFSIISYIVCTTLRTRQTCRHYRTNLSILRAATLVSFYLAGNYYIVHELAGPNPLAALWWVLTAATPIIYIIWGIRKKDPAFLWIGLALVAAAIFTVRYYHHILPAEAAMVLGGLVLITGAWWVIRYLHTPKKGFTSAIPDQPHILQHLPAETLILAETFKPQSQPTGPDTRFGGGSGGGGGAGGNY